MCISCFAQRSAPKYAYPFVNIVSLLDENSIHSTLVKVHSIVKSSKLPNQLRFYFLFFEKAKKDSSPTRELISGFESLFNELYPSIFIETKIWESSPFLQKYLRNDKFETEIIFSRFYLPRIYASLEKFIYLDNDLVVNCDMRDLMNYPLTSRHPNLLSVKEKDQEQRQSVNPSRVIPLERNRLPVPRDPRSSRKGRNGGRQLALNDNQLMQNRPLGFYSNPAAFGMVFESHSFYFSYLTSHFNQSHPLYQRAEANILQLYPPPTQANPSTGNGKIRVQGQQKLHPSRYSFFLNGGVVVFDCARWNQHNLTGRAEELIARNAVESIYSTSIGDQAIFFLLAFLSVPEDFLFAFLPAQFNMRRSPKQTVQLLSKSVQGIVHFAGITHGDALLLCANPFLSLTLISSGALQLYLSVLVSLTNQLASLSPFENSVARTMTGKMLNDTASVCPTAIESLQQHLRQQRQVVQFNGGEGRFSWPPPALSVPAPRKVSLT
jgi:lipopolysaccharide biosynthesis glycosyltransferase